MSRLKTSRFHLCNFLCSWILVWSFEQVYRHLQSLMWILHHLGPPPPHTFLFPAVSVNNINEEKVLRWKYTSTKYWGGNTQAQSSEVEIHKHKLFQEPQIVSDNRSWKEYEKLLIRVLYTVKKQHSNHIRPLLSEALSFLTEINYDGLDVM
jgi:hypothetical protein